MIALLPVGCRRIPHFLRFSQSLLLPSQGTVHRPREYAGSLGFEGFQVGIGSGDVSHGAAISLFMLPVLLVVVVAMLRFIRRREI